MSLGESPSNGGKSELHIARIGLISAIVVAVCGLIGTVLTVFGSTIAAYLSTRAAQDPVVIPLRATQTAEARLANPGGTNPPGGLSSDTFLIENRLILPVHIFINDNYINDLPAGSNQPYSSDNLPVDVRWQLVKETTSSGNHIGEEMSAVFHGVRAGDTVLITNLAGGQPYFYPQITNQTPYECDITINMGWDNEVNPGASLPPNTDNVGVGYFRLYRNSNVTLDCGDTLYWWGVRPGESETESFYDEVESDTGVIEFTLEP